MVAKPLNARAFLTALSDSSDEDSDREFKPTLLNSAPINQSRVTRARSPLNDAPVVPAAASTARKTRSSKRSAPVTPQPTRTRSSKVIDSDNDDVPEPKRTRLSKVADHDDDSDDDDELLSSISNSKSPPEQSATKASKKRKSRDIEPEEANGWYDTTDESPVLSPPTRPANNEPVRSNQNVSQPAKNGVPQTQKIVVGSALRQQKTSKITMLQEPTTVTAHSAMSSSLGSQSINTSTQPINKPHQSSRSPTPLTPEELVARKSIEAFAEALTTCVPLSRQDAADNMKIAADNLKIMRQWRSNLKSAKFEPDDGWRVMLNNRLKHQSFSVDFLLRLRVALQAIQPACKTGRSQGSLDINESEQLEFLGNSLDFLCYANKQFGWKPQARDIKTSINGLYKSVSPFVGDHNRHWQKLSQQIYAAATQIWPDVTPLEPVGNSAPSSRSIPRNNTTPAALAAQFSRSKHVGSSAPRPNPISSNSFGSDSSEVAAHRPINNVFPSENTFVNSPSNFSVAARVHKPLKSALRNSTNSSGKSVQWKPDDQLNQIQEIERIGKSSTSAKFKKDADKDAAEGKSFVSKHVGEPDVEADETGVDDSAVALNQDVSNWFCPSCQLPNPEDLRLCQHCRSSRDVSPRNASPRAISQPLIVPSSFASNDLPHSASLIAAHVAPMVDHSYSFVPSISSVHRDQSSHVAAGAPSLSVAHRSASSSTSKQLVKPHLSLLQCLRDTGALGSGDQPILEPAPLSPQEMPPPLEAVPEYETRFTVPVNPSPYVPVPARGQPQGEPDHPMPEVGTSHSSVLSQLDSSPPPLNPVGSSLHSPPQLHPPVPVPVVASGPAFIPPIRPASPPNMPPVKKEKIMEPSRTQLDDARYLPPDLPEFPFGLSSPPMRDPLPVPLTSEPSHFSHHPNIVSSVVGASGSGDVPVLSNTEVVDEERRKRRQMEKEQRELDRGQKLQPVQRPTLSREDIESMRVLQELGIANERKQRRRVDLDILRTRLDDFRQEEKKREDMSKPLNQRPSSLL